MNDTLKNKHVLGALTLRDLKGTIDALRVRSVEIDGQIWERFVLRADGLHMWSTEEHYLDAEAADQIYDLDMPAKVKDGKVILTDVVTGIEETLVFGRTEFVPTKIEIL